jgi:hypothetical protein
MLSSGSLAQFDADLQVSFPSYSQNLTALTELTPTRRVVDGAGDETRTRDIQLGRLALYQLSYSRPERPSLHRGGRRAMSLPPARHCGGASQLGRAINLRAKPVRGSGPGGQSDYLHRCVGAMPWGMRRPLADCTTGRQPNQPCQCERRLRPRSPLPISGNPSRRWPRRSKRPISTCHGA